MPKLKFAIPVLAALLVLGVAPAFAAAPAMQIVRDEEIEQGLKTMCTPVFEQAGVSPKNVRFILVQDDELNAFVAGGQNIFINTGLILKTENPMELVGVIAHETGHIALGHLFRAQEAEEDYTVQSLLAGAVGIAAGVVGHSGNAAIGSMAAGQGMAQRSALSRSRTVEASADQAGVQFLEGAHLPVTGFLSFMKKIAGQELLPENNQSEYVRNHPLTQDRIDFLQSAADQQAAGADKGSYPPEWNTIHGRMKAKLLGFLWPDRALQDRSDTIDAQYARAIAWYRKGDDAKSVGMLDEIIAQEPKNPYFYEMKGQTLFEAAQVDAAAAAYKKAVEFAPRAGLIRSAYAHTLLESKTAGRAGIEEAVKQLQVSLESEPRSADAYHELGIAYGRLGQDGQSRLALAEEYALEGKGDLAKREAMLALKSLPAGTPARLRAEDLIDMEKEKKPDKKD